MLGTAWIFFRRDLLIDGRSGFALLFHLLNVGLTVASYGFLSRLVEPEALARWTGAEDSYFGFALIGVATSGALFTALTGLSRSLQLQQRGGALKPVFFSQTRVEAVLLLSCLYPLARAAIDLIVYLLVGWIFGGVSLARANLLGAGLVAGLAIVAFASLGLWAAAFTVLLRHGDPVVWAIGSCSWLLGGVLYPPALLPLPLRWAADVFPLTYALQGMRAALLAGSSLEELLHPALFLVGFSAVMIPLGVLLFSIGLRRARVRGAFVER